MERANENAEAAAEKDIERGESGSNEEYEQFREDWETPESVEQTEKNGSSLFKADEPNDARNSHDSQRPSYESKRGQNNPRNQLQRHRSSNTLDSTISIIRSRTAAQQRKFGHKLEHIPTGPDVVVEFDGKSDPFHPKNWPMRKKVYTTLVYGLCTMGSTFASSIFSTATTPISQEFHVSPEVVTLGTSLLLIGFGLGPLIWAPLSELYGRKIAVLTPVFVSAMFTFGSGAGKDIQTILICRFFTGFFGSAPVTNTGGVLGDIWTPQQRGNAIVGYALAVVGGPTLGPLVGGAIVQSYLGWRWTEYITGIMQMLFLVLGIIFLDESYPPVLLVYKARRLRIKSGNWSLHAEHEEWDPSLIDFAHKYLVRPFQMLFTPICFSLVIYASFVYGILYANLSAYAIEFQEVRGWNAVVGALPFLALLIGIMIGGVINICFQPYYFRKTAQNNGRPLPEARLPPMMIGGIIFASGMFIFAWTSDPSIPWIAPVIGCVLTGTGFITIFQAALNYLIDTFARYGASAVAANTFSRSIFAAAFPLFIMPMYHRLGVAWGTTVFACVAALLIPIPFVLYIFGKRIRARGYWSRESL